jgi:nucleoside-diphosphate-sugar epimerase
MSKNIGVMGCGWLGKPLAIALIKNGYTVKGTTTHISKLEELRSVGIDPYMVDLQETFIDGGIDQFLSGLDALVINVPPGLRSNPDSDYTGRLELLVKNINARPSIKRLIFISTTSVFADLPTIPFYDEFSTPNDDSPAGKKLIAGEKMMQNAGARTTIVRPGGLIGEDRHPIKFLAGKKEVANPKAPVNLTDQSALVKAIILLLQITKELDTYHVISEPHQNRADYYRSKALEKGLQPPEFSGGKSVGKKIVSRFS